MYVKEHDKRSALLISGVFHVKNIDPRLSPDLLYTLYCMGHGDEIILSDAHFPAHSVNENVIRADGNAVEALLDAIIPLFEIDSYVSDAVVMMAPVPEMKFPGM